MLELKGCREFAGIRRVYCKLKNKIPVTVLKPEVTEEKFTTA